MKNEDTQQRSDQPAANQLRADEQSFPFAMHSLRLSRRNLVRRGAILGLSIPAVGALLAACGGSSKSTATSASSESTAAPTTASGSGDATPAAPTTPATGNSGTPVASATSPVATPNTGPSVTQGGTLKVGIGVDALTFDPHNYQATTDLQLDNLLYDTLVGTDPTTFELAPRLATKWETTNPTTWRFTLRDGVKFTDGTDFNADAVKFNIERMQKAARAKSYIAPVSSVNVVDPMTVELVTKSPSAALIRNLSVAILSIVSPTAAQKGDTYLVSNPVGTGPFKLKEWVQKQHITIDRNDDYWGDKTPLDEIIFYPITDDSTRLNGYKAGNVDVMVNPPLETVPSLQADDNNQVLLLPVTRTVWFGFNIGDDTLKNEKVRQALTMALDREGLVKAITGGLERMAVGIVPPRILKPNFDLPYTYDKDGAKKLLADAGFKDGFKIKFWTPQGRYPKDKEIAEAIQQQLSQIGVTADLSVVEWGTYLDSLARHEQQLYLIGWGFSSGDPDGGLRQIAWSQSSFNYTNLKDPAVDAALDAAAAELDPAKRADMYNTLQKGLLEAAEFAPIYHMVDIAVANKKVHGFLITPLEFFDLKATYMS